MKYPRPRQNQFVLHNFDTWEMTTFHMVSYIIHTLDRWDQLNFSSWFSTRYLSISKKRTSWRSRVRHCCLPPVQCMWSAAYSKTPSHRAQIAQIDETTSEDPKPFVFFSNIWVRLSCLPSVKFRIVSVLKSWSVSGVLRLNFWHNRTL